MIRPDDTTSDAWLRTYYSARAAVSAVWVALVVTVGRGAPAAAAMLFVAYPAWDALANGIDARRSGGLRRNPSQALNLVVSAVTAVVAAVALGKGQGPALLVFAAWAGLAGLLQLVTAVRRWKSHGAQWAMALSGAQSVLAAVFMAKRAGGPSPSITAVAPYAAFGAFYFLVSAVLLFVKARRRAVAA